MAQQLRVAGLIQLILIVVVWLSNDIAVVAWQAEPKNVKDYYLLIPEKFILLSRETREQLLSDPGMTVDIGNGYLSYNASDNPEEFELALFKRPDSSYLVAFSIPYDSDFPDNTSLLYFLRYEKGSWRDVTKETLPLPFNKRLTYRLPRLGTTIKVINEKGKKVYDLIWSGGKFEIVPMKGGQVR
ncbi:MAG: hypothetical protein AB1489_43555 [Acidobacteriota bacterium]